VQTCGVAYMRQYRRQPKEIQRGKDYRRSAPLKRYQRKRAQANADLIREIAQQAGCADRHLGGCDGRLEYHHRNPAEKAYSVSRMSAASWALIEREMSKCDVLCRAHYLARHKAMREAHATSDKIPGSADGI
jgi:hypothetical protein